MSKILTIGSKIVTIGSKIAVKNWSVYDVPNLKLWLKADDVIKDGSNKVSQWNDNGFSLFHATQSTGTYQPLWVDNEINGHPIIRFDGVNDFMDFSTNILPTDAIFSLFIVSKNTKATTNSAIFTQYSSGVAGRSILGYDIVGGADLFGFWPSTSFTYLGSQYDVFSMTNDASASGFKIYLNSVLKNTGTATIVQNINSQLGGQQYGNYFKGDIAEIIISTSTLSNENRQLVETYLINKYNITT